MDIERYYRHCIDSLAAATLAVNESLRVLGPAGRPHAFASAAKTMLETALAEAQSQRDFCRAEQAKEASS